MSESKEEKTYMVLSMGYDDYVLPFDPALLKVWAHAEILKKNYNEPNYIVPVENSKLTFSVMSEQTYLQYKAHATLMEKDKDE